MARMKKRTPKMNGPCRFFFPDYPDHPLNGMQAWGVGPVIRKAEGVHDIHSEAWGRDTEMRRYDIPTDQFPADAQFIKVAWRGKPKALEFTFFLLNPHYAGYLGNAYQDLFNHMSDKYDLSLLESEMEEICRICAAIQATKEQARKEAEKAGKSLEE